MVGAEHFTTMCLRVENEGISSFRGTPRNKTMSEERKTATLHPRVGFLCQSDECIISTESEFKLKSYLLYFSTWGNQG